MKDFSIVMFSLDHANAGITTGSENVRINFQTTWVTKLIPKNLVTPIAILLELMKREECCREAQIDKFLRELSVAVAFFSIKWCGEKTPSN